MDASCLDRLDTWFGAYAGGFLGGGVEDDRNLRLKIEHTMRVRRDIGAIAGAEGFDGGDATLARAVGLLHDVGRFSQYARFRTFLDSRSENHGELGAKVLAQEGALEGLRPDEAAIVLGAVRYHNALRVPRLGEPRTERFIRLVRDADKLDIWGVMLAYFAAPPGERASAVGLGLPEDAPPSDEVRRTLAEGRMVTLKLVRNMDDLKLLHLSWLFDLNFRSTFRLFLERGIIEQYEAILPDDTETARLISTLKELAYNRAG